MTGTYLKTIQALYALGFFGSLAFIVRYSLTVTWWKSQIGQNMWFLAALDCQFFGLALGTTIFKVLPAIRVVTIVFLLEFVIIVWWRAFLLESVQKRERKQNGGKKFGTRANTGKSKTGD